MPKRRKSKHFRRRSPPGAPPGTVLPDPGAPAGRVEIMGISADELVERGSADVRDLPALRERLPLVWVNVDGLGDAAILQKLGEMFGLHRLALEDVVHVHQRAKAERYGEHVFFVARMLLAEEECDSEQVSFFVGPNFVLTFQERAGGDRFDPVRARLRATGSRARLVRSDLLFHALLDVIVDSYFPLIENYGERVDTLEEQVLARQSGGVMGRLHLVRRDLLSIRRVIWPLRDALNTLLRDSGPPFGDEARVYLRDVQDHMVQIIDLLENYRDISGGLTEVYLSVQAQRTNEVMKVLTVISTIFIPLTFIVGVYGMNFDHMPELRWWWSYPLLWISMIAIALGQLLYFKRRGWLGEHTDTAGDRADAPPRE